MPLVTDDPLVRLLPADPPGAFTNLPPAEQSFRARIYLMVWVLSEDEAYSWDAALTTNADFLQSMRETLATSSDEYIAAAVQRTINDRTPEPRTEPSSPVQ